eukprot:6464686-Amphidinium_carterae.2
MDHCCRALGLQHSAAFEYNVYQETGAETLADAFMELMSFVLEAWSDADQPAGQLPQGRDSFHYSSSLEERMSVLSAKGVHRREAMERKVLGVCS